MEVQYERVAGLDIGKATLTVCVRTPGPRGGRRAETRTFSTMTRSLHVMRDWLLAEGVTVAAMESTSTYWKGAFYCLEEVMEIWLVNAAHIKAFDRRKSDVRDAEWIAQLLEVGLLRPSFVPPPDIRRLRMLTRYRVQLMADRTREITRLELMLEDASVKLSSVAASLTSVSARAMLGALIGGESDPRVLADLAKGKMRRKIPALTEALTGHFDVGHAQLARSMLARIEAVQTALAELNEVIAAAFEPWSHQLQLLQSIPGVGEKVAQVIIAETGADMSRFPTPEHLASWAGVAPGMHESAGKFHAIPQQVADRDAGGGGRLGCPDEGRELSLGSARSAHRPTRRGTGAGGGRALDPGLGLLDAHSRRALPRPRAGLAGQAQRRGPRPPVGRPARTARPHRSPRSRRLTELQKNRRTGFARPALTRACNTLIHGSVILCDLDRSPWR
jgi:transposase